MRVAQPGGPRAPDLLDPVLGYRHWRLHDARLWSPFKAYAWSPGVNAARCTLGTGHPEPAPGHECACGLHAWYRPCPRLGYATPDLVGGAVALWGDVELHPTGLRAQYAAIIALVLPLSRTAKRRRVVDVADSLEVDAVPARELETVALHHAAPAPSGLAPGAH
jgi:hypothetical protein